MSTDSTPPGEPGDLSSGPRPAPAGPAGEALRLAEELESLRSLCRVVVEAWHGQSSVSIDLAMSRLESLIRKVR